MNKKDKIIQQFLSHDLLITKYKLKKNQLPNSLKAAKDSEVPIIKAIALMVDALESGQVVTDVTLRTLINNYLNEAAI